MSAAFDFLDLYYTLVFILALWVAGKLSHQIGLPPLVGEILTGIGLGPHGADIVPFPNSFMLIGEVGLLLLVLEAGLDVDIEMLRLIGLRGFGVAIVGSMFPLALGTGIGFAFGLDFKGAIASGATLAPTSMGIALNVLRSGKVLNTPTGQLVIAAAVLDDVIALVLLSEIKALDGGTMIDFVLPIVASGFFLLLFGYLALRIMPVHMEGLIQKYIPKKHQDNCSLGMTLLLAMALLPTTYYLKSSYLLGVFLAGLCFCTDVRMHRVWIHQVKRLLTWLLRIFFAATIGFEVPISDFADFEVIWKGLIYCLPVVGKIVTGFFANPLRAKEFFTIAFAMSAWGEFAFIIAVYSKEHNIMDDNTFSSLVFAILLSVILAPYALSFILNHYNTAAGKHFDSSIAHQLENDHLEHSVYYELLAKSRGKWGIQQQMIKLIRDLDLEVVDFQAHHKLRLHGDRGDWLLNRIYLRDPELEALVIPTEQLSEEKQMALSYRADTIVKAFEDVLAGSEPEIHFHRWLPGKIYDSDTEEDEEDSPNSPVLHGVENQHMFIDDLIRHHEEAEVHGRGPLRLQCPERYPHPSEPDLHSLAIGAAAELEDGAEVEMTRQPVRSGKTPLKGTTPNRSNDVTPVLAPLEMSNGSPSNGSPIAIPSMQQSDLTDTVLKSEDSGTPPVRSSADAILKSKEEEPPVMEL